VLGRWSSEYLVQRQERSHGRGIPDHPMRPTTRSTPVRRQGQPQTEIRSCENPRMRVCSPTSQGFAPTVARSSYQQLLARLWRGEGCCASEVDKGHKRVGKGASPRCRRNESSCVAPCPRAGREREHRPNAWARRARRRTEIAARTGLARHIAREDGRKNTLMAHPTAHRFDRTKL